MRTLAALTLAQFILFVSTGGAAAQTAPSPVATTSAFLVNANSAAGTAHVWMLAGTQRHELPATVAKNSKTAMDSGAPSAGANGALTLASIAAAVIPFGPILATALNFMGMGHRSHRPTQRDTWALTGARSGLSVTSQTPSFELAYANIAGVDPSAYEPVLLKLSPTSDNWRVVSQTEREISNGGTLSGANFSEHRVAIDVTPLESGRARISPKSALEPGEYGLVFRPLKRETTSNETANPAGYPMPGQTAGPTPLWQTVWDFAVAGTSTNPSAGK